MCCAAGRRKIPACHRELARTGTASQKGGTLWTEPDPRPFRMVDCRGAPPSVGSLALVWSQSLRRPASGCHEALRKGLLCMSDRPT
jgi:hypothetical protein